MLRKDLHHETLKTELAAARAIADKADAEGRDFTPAELATAAEHLRLAKSARKQYEQAEADEHATAAIAELGASLNGAAKDARPDWASRSGAYTRWVKSTAETIEKVSHANGAKALVSGSIDVAAPIFPGITPIAQYPVRLIDLLIDRVSLTDTNTFEFLRQTARVNNAAVVADAGTKPTSVYTVAEIEDRVRVVAHLSEAIPERYVADHTELQDFLQSEMEEGLIRAVENQVVSGNGIGENMTGILATSGLLVQGWSTSLLTTLRKAATTMAVAGEVPNAWVIHPSDVETIDLLTDNEKRYYYGGPQNQLGGPTGTGTNPIWSLPIIQSLAVTAGSALLGDWNYVRLVVREDARLDADRSGTLFETNRVKLRLEGRYGVAVRRPSAFCTVDLTA